MSSQDRAPPPWSTTALVCDLCGAGGEWDSQRDRAITLGRDDYLPLGTQARPAHATPPKSAIRNSFANVPMAERVQSHFEGHRRHDRFLQYELQETLLLDREEDSFTMYGAIKISQIIKQAF